MTVPLFRERIVERLRQDLIGPLSVDEMLSDRPTQRYSTGILYPIGSRMGPAEDEDGGTPVNGSEDGQLNAIDDGVSLHAALKPSVAGISFAIRQSKPKQMPTLNVDIDCAVYERVAVDDGGTVVEGEPSDRTHERWRRESRRCSVPVELELGENRIDLEKHSIEGLELYILVTPATGLLTVTAALSNQRKRGSSSAYDEAQHFFQVELTVSEVSAGSFSPRPSRRADVDDDGRTASLIYRDVNEYVVGHTCSARASIDNGHVVALSTAWIPATIVPSVSDEGDPIFNSLREDIDNSPLNALWLAKAPPSELARGLERVVSAYADWIIGQESRIQDLPSHLRAQARKQVERCSTGAERMMEGIKAIKGDSSICQSFQLAQETMLTQFGWQKQGKMLVWRPFQLAFQLLAIPSLANREHIDRETMDLLWFPTGGGKTEAYLALTAFVILLRRLQAPNEGAGVSVLMRYTLRLLTVQQFQRAAAMICACELIRRRAGSSSSRKTNLGTKPVGIGLWVGAATTPLTLRDALNRPSGDPSTPEQITDCPCCGAPLHWRLTPEESSVECQSDIALCELAGSGKRLPIWTIDEEIYRAAPSLVIGTVDKFAQIVRKPETGVLFGRIGGFLPPDLIIQDELHLISGPLGSIAGLYEVAIDELCRREGVRPKIVGSTATIRRAEDQIRSLFDRATYQFPSPGLDADNSGFAVTNHADPGRLYVGVTTAGRSATYMLQAVVASLLQAATDKTATPLERDYYWTLVTYFNSLRELGRALVLMQDDVPISISQFANRRSEPNRTLEAPAELTSRVPSYEIRDMLAALGKPATDANAVDLLVASNMISVGMDIPRLGLMLVNAQPKTIAEYIQATSRVGRGKVPGVVVTVYNGMRARDRSHYETFETWHRSLYRDVEPTSVTPFASRAQDKALHAVLVALVRHTVSGMDKRPLLDVLRRVGAERVAGLIESRVARVDPAERTSVSQKLTRLIDEWASRGDLQTYWDDYERKISLMMSAEQYAAKADLDSDLEPEGARRALWPTPNSMREVEAGAPFVLRHVLRAETQ